jgi:hypothetical protein
MYSFLLLLKAVQVAIEENIVKLEKSAPEKKVGLIAFNQFVNIIGDGKIDPIKMIDIDDKESIKKVADRTPEFDKIQKNKDVLSKKLLKLVKKNAFSFLIFHILTKNLFEIVLKKVELLRWALLSIIVY